MKPEIKERISQIQNGIVPEGYKKTDFGIFPEDWETDKTLADVGKFGKGKGLPGDKLIESGVPCIGYGDIYMKYTYFFNNALSFTDEKTASESTPIEKGTLLFTGTGETPDEIGKCVCYNGNETIYAGGDIITFVPKSVNPMFLAYQQYQHFSLRKKYAYGQGNSVVHIHKEELEKLPVAYPISNTEQEKIVDILEKWYRAIELQEELINELEIKKKAAVQRLIVPKAHWNKTPLKQVLRERKKYALKDSEFIHVSLTKAGVVDKTEQYNRDFLVSSDEKKYKITHYNDICYNPANLKFGVICINKYGDAIFSPIYVTYEISKKYNPDFIAAILTSNNFINRVRRFEEGTVYERMAVKSDDFIKEAILLPDLNEQNNIAEKIKIFNDAISLQQSKLDILKQQQKSMQQLLLTGIVRVNK